MEFICWFWRIRSDFRYSIKHWSIRWAKRSTWKHVTFRKYVAATQNSPGYVVLNHRPRRNARTYTPPGQWWNFPPESFAEGAKFIPQNFQQRATPPWRNPLLLSSFFLLCRPPPRQTRNSRRDFDEIPRGLWTAVLGPTMASNLHPVATPGRYPNLFRLSCKLVDISKVTGNSRSSELDAIWLRNDSDIWSTMNIKAKDNTERALDDILYK